MSESNLLPQHDALIKASAIDPDVAAERGYSSATTRAALKRLGFSDFQCNAPALVVPVFSVVGDLTTHQIRPDKPRFDSRGKVVKYETPRHTRMALDIPRRCRSRGWLATPECPLIITEGARKADAAVSRGFCCIAVLGVWNWRGTNADGGLVALADWELIALKGRAIY